MRSSIKPDAITLHVYDVNDPSRYGFILSEDGLTFELGDNAEKSFSVEDSLKRIYNVCKNNVGNCNIYGYTSTIFDENNKVSGYSYKHIIRDRNDVVEIEATAYKPRMAYDLCYNILNRVICKIDGDPFTKAIDDNNHELSQIPFNPDEVSITYFSYNKAFCDWEIMGYIKTSCKDINCITKSFEMVPDLMSEYSNMTVEDVLKKVAEACNSDNGHPSTNIGAWTRKDPTDRSKLLGYDCRYLIYFDNSHIAINVASVVSDISAISKAIDIAKLITEEYSQE